MDNETTSNKDKDSSGSPEISTLTGPLERVIEKLHAPPFLFTLGVLIILAIIAALSIEALTLLWIPALILAIFALIAWLAPNFLKKSKSRAKTRVRLRADDIGETGTVKGIEGLPIDRGSDIDVDMDVKKIKGRAVGISASSENEPHKDA